MANTEKRIRNGRTVCRAHYRTPDGAQRNKTFPRMVDADRFLAGIESSKLVGGYVDPSLARVTVGDWSERRLAGQAHLKTFTRERYPGSLREHVLPRWASVKLANVSHAEVQSWVTALCTQRSPETVRKIHRVLSHVLTPWRSRTAD